VENFFFSKKIKKIIFKKVRKNFQKVEKIFYDPGEKWRKSGEKWGKKEKYFT